MSNKIPVGLRDEIRVLVYALADDFDYSIKSRTENADFMESMISHPEVGQKLHLHINKAEIKTYIKDAVLNRYQKERRRGRLPQDRDEFVRKGTGRNLAQIQKGGKGVTFHKDCDTKNHYVIIVEGTYEKWESALRKAMLFAGRCPCFDETSNTKETMLILTTNGRVISRSDRDQLGKVLGEVGTTPFIV